MKTSESFMQLAAALAKAQAVFAVPVKSKEAIVKSKDGTYVQYTYRYADLSDVIDAVRPGLAANGLSILSLISLEIPNRPMLETILMHESGEWISMLYPVELSGQPQAIGGQLTYARRYSISCMLGVASEDDDDANAAQGNNAQTGKKSNQQPAKLASSSGATTQTTTTQKPNPAPQTHSNASSSGQAGQGTGQDQTVETAARVDAIAFYGKWAKKLVDAKISHPENVATIDAIIKANSIAGANGKADIAITPDEIMTRGKRIMINVCNMTGEIEDKFAE